MIVVVILFSYLSVNNSPKDQKIDVIYGCIDEDFAENPCLIPTYRVK
jgi:hypothetical protein